MNKTDIVRDYRAKNPDMAALKLARIIYEKNKPLFPSVDGVRTSLRYIEGKLGKSSRSKKDASFVKSEARPYNPYKLPKSDESSYKPFVIRGIRRLFVMSDVHIPYHNVEALTAAIRFAKKKKVDGILLNGDILDFFGLSRFCKDPRKRNFAGELNMFKDFMKVLDKNFPNAKIFYKLGNHEERYFHFLWQKAGELDGVEEFELENIIKSRSKNVTVIGEKRIIKANGLNIIHGHEFSHGFFNPVNIARGLFLRAKASAMQGHSHGTSEHTESDINEHIVTTWSTGCLCELHPQYAPINKWNHGFAIVELNPNGKLFEVINKRILKGKIL